MTKKNDIYENLCQLSLFSKEKGELLRQITAYLQDSRKLSYIVTPNPEQIVLANQDLDFSQALRQADIKLPDGIGLVLARQWLGWLGKARPVRQRIAGADVVQALLELAQAKKYRVVVVGGRGYGDYVQHRSPHWVWLPAYRDVTQPTAAEETELAAKLQRLKPDLVFVALGAPWQERWVVDHWSVLERSHTKVVMVVGGAFDFITGQVSRAPSMIQTMGLEWLYRLVHQPWRWQRQLRLIQFIGLVIGASLFAPRLTTSSVQEK